MKKLMISFVIFSALFLFISNCYSQKPIEWRIHSPQGKGWAEFAIETEWADALTKESNGKLVVTLYPLSSLGFKDADMLRMCGGNVIEGFLFYPGYISRDDPILALTCPEMIAYERQHFINFVPYAFEAAKERLKKWKIRLSVVFPSPSCQVGIIAKGPYNTLETLKGKKIRGWELQQVETMKKLGIPTQMMAQSELYLALKTGVLDGAIYLTGPYLSRSMYEVAPYWSTLYQGTMMLGLATSETAFNALPPDLQEMMKRVEVELMNRWKSEAIGWCEKYDGNNLKTLIEKGAKVLPTFSEDDQNVLVKTGIEAWRNRAAELGEEAVKYQQKLEKNLIRTKP